MKKLLPLVALLLLSTADGLGSGTATLKTGLQTLPAGPTTAEGFDLSNEKFYLFVPPNYTGAEPFGVLVFLSPADKMEELPPDWMATIQRKQLILIAPQKVGNNQNTVRRMGLALVSATKLPKIANINPARIYASGFSGGARVASMTAFNHPELFSGAVAICGIDFPHEVPKVRATENDKYGTFQLSEQLEIEARKKVKFVLITGSGDFRHGNILDIYSGGFLTHHYAVKLIDMPGMDHTLCSGMTLANAIDFLDAKR